jgi:hypothetical protein
MPTLELDPVTETTIAEMPTKSVKKSPRPKKAKDSDTVQISKSELQALINASLAAKAQATTSTGFSVDHFSQAMEAILANANANQKLTLAEALKVNSRPSNGMLEWPNISVYNPEGERDHPRPKLVDSRGKPRITTYGGCPMNTIDTMLREEIVAFNEIQDDAYLPERNWRATITRSGDAERLDITLGDLGNPSVNVSIPPVTTVLYELKMGKKLPNINALIAARAAKEVNPEAYINRVLDQLETLSLTV